MLVELGVDVEAGAGAGGGDQADDDLVADERFAAPVLADEREEAMLDLVPLAGAGREVADGDRQPALVGEPLQLGLPQTGAVAVRAAAVGGDRQAVGVGVALVSELLPPPLDRGDGELGGVMVDPDVDPAAVGGEGGCPTFCVSGQSVSEVDFEC